MRREWKQKSTLAGIGRDSEVSSGGTILGVRVTQGDLRTVRVTVGLDLGDGQVNR